MSLTTDPVADFLSRIRNAMRARHAKVDSPASKLKLEIARILKEEGFIANFKATEEEGRKVLRVYLKYGNNNEAAISNVERVSRLQHYTRFARGDREQGWRGPGRSAPGAACSSRHGLRGRSAASPPPRPAPARAALPLRGEADPRGGG